MIIIPPFQDCKSYCVPDNGHPGDDDFPPVQFIELSGAVVFSLISPPKSTTFFANSFSNHSLLSAHPKGVGLADVFSTYSLDKFLIIPGERTGFPISCLTS